MSYNILTMWRSAQSVLGDKNKTTQYDSPLVAARAIPGSHLVCLNPALRPFPPPGLPLFAPRAKSPRAATGAGAKGRVHSQSAAAVNWSRAGSLPAATTAHQPGCGRCLSPDISYLNRLPTKSDNFSKKSVWFCSGAVVGGLPREKIAISRAKGGLSNVFGNTSPVVTQAFLQVVVF